MDADDCFSNIIQIIRGTDLLAIENLQKSSVLLPSWTAQTIEVLTTTEEILLTHIPKKDIYNLMMNQFGTQIDENRSVYRAVQTQNVNLLNALIKYEGKFKLNFMEVGMDQDLPLHAAIKTRNLPLINIVLKYFKEHTLDINQKGD